MPKQLYKFYSKMWNGLWEFPVWGIFSHPVHSNGYRTGKLRVPAGRIGSGIDILGTGRVRVRVSIVSYGYGSGSEKW